MKRKFKLKKIENLVTTTNNISKSLNEMFDPFKENSNQLVSTLNKLFTPFNEIKDTINYSGLIKEGPSYLFLKPEKNINADIQQQKYSEDIHFDKSEKYLTINGKRIFLDKLDSNKRNGILLLYTIQVEGTKDDILSYMPKFNEYAHLYGIKKRIKNVSRKTFNDYIYRANYFLRLYSIELVLKKNSEGKFGIYKKN